MTVFVPKKKQRSNSLPEMTLRDYFAAKAMQGQFTTTSADRDFLNPDFRRDVDGPKVAERIARISYEMADAMLKARGQN